MSLILRLFSVATFVIFIHIIALALGLYRTLPWFDVPMHFFGGVAMAVAAVEYLKYLGEKQGSVLSIPLLVEIIAIMGFVALIAIFWEWYEFLADNVVIDIREKFGLMQPSLRDTMADFFFDLLGGAVVTAQHYFKKGSKI